MATSTTTPNRTSSTTPEKSVRHLPGYVPEFDLDVKVGDRGESYLTDIITAMLHGNEGTIEVKTDERASDTGNVYIEYSSNGKPSGIARTQSDLWATVIGGVVIIVPTEAVRAVVAGGMQLGETRSMNRGSNPTDGVVVQLEDYITRCIAADGRIRREVA